MDLFKKEVRPNDLYVKSDGNQIDIEVQSSKDDNTQKRARYNGSILTVTVTEKAKYTKMYILNVCVIFISKFDRLNATKLFITL